MKGAAQFMLHWLITDPAEWITWLPILLLHPENTMKIKGKEFQVGMATTMDMSIIRELFTAAIKTSSHTEY